MSDSKSMDRATFVRTWSAHLDEGLVIYTALARKYLDEGLSPNDATLMVGDDLKADAAKAGRTGGDTAHRDLLARALVRMAQQGMRP